MLLLSPCIEHLHDTLSVQVVGAGLETPAAATLHAPMALLPMPYPLATFQRAKAAACVFNSMIDRVAADGPYLEAVLASAAAHDEFTVSPVSSCCCCLGPGPPPPPPPPPPP